MPDKYGIIGYPLIHSLSPFMHNRYAYYLGKNESYEAFEIMPGRLPDALNQLYKDSVLGLNVTVPYKKKIIEYIYDIDDCAAEIGAVNTLKYTDDGYVGFNTDAAGLKLSIDESGIDLKGKDILILGAGGAARAAAYVCRASDCSSITVLNRTYEHALDLAEDFEATPLDYTSLIELNKPEYIAIQTTNVGMYPDIHEKLPLPASLFMKISAGIDLIYNPSETDFIKSVSKSGAKVLNGFPMLMNQAVASRKIWKPKEVISNDIRRKVYNECLDYSWS